MNERVMKQALENIARRGVPENVNLLPGITARLERKSFVNTLRARPVLMFLLVLLALAMLTGVAYAIGRATGYIPGIGLVNQDVPLRVLAEPVTVMRDGITLTVEQVVLSADQTVLVYKVEGIPADAFASEGNTGGNSSDSSVSSNLDGMPEVSYSSGGNAAQCVADARLLLPDGSVVRSTSGEGSGWLSGFERRFEYAPIPADVNRAVFAVSCIEGTRSGRLPEHWEISLRFVPAPSDMTILPLVDVSPSPSNTLQSAITVEQVTETEDGYILIGKFRLTGYPADVVPNGFQVNWVKFTDANGEAVDASPANNIQFENKLNGEFSWAYEIKGKQHAFPITITLDAVSANILNATTEFELDTGDAPQVGQSWVVDQDLQIAGYHIQKVEVQRTSNGYDFRFKVDPDLTMLGVEIAGHRISNSNGSSAGAGSGNIYQHLEYKDGPPSGKLTVNLKDILVEIHGPWQAQWSPEPLPNSLYGISLHVDQFIPLNDGYYLIGHTEWADDRIAGVNAGDWTLKALDSSGRELPVEPAMYGADLVSQNLQPNQWAYHLYGKNFNGPVSLRVSLVDVQFKQPIKVTLDLPSEGFDFPDQNLGKTWQLDSISLDVPGIPATVSSMKYVKVGDLRGFEIAIQADSVLQGLDLSFHLTTDGVTSISGGGGSNRDEKSGTLLSWVLTDAPMRFPLELNADSAKINGMWETTWNPPADTSGSQPIYLEQPRLDLYSWKQITANADTIPVPAEMTGRLLTMRGALAPEPSLFLSNLDGTEEHGLVFGNGAISPDGATLIFADENGVFKRMDVATGVTSTLNIPHDSMINIFWSPDGRYIAFDQVADTFHVYVMDSNGENLRQLTFGNESTFVRGWSGDGKQILVAVSKDAVNYLLQLVDVETATTTDLFIIQGEQASISPTGAWIAYVDKVDGKTGGGIYVSRLDGSERRLFVQLDHWVVSHPAWSPDGQWLAFSIFDTDQFNQENPEIAAININLDWFWVVPLPKVSGQLTAWILP